MTTKTRRSFTDEFKQESVALLASSGRPLTRIAAELGIQPSVLRNWRRRFGGPRGGCRAPLRGRRRPPPNDLTGACDEQAKEIARLKRELDHLRMERGSHKK